MALTLVGILHAEAPARDVDFVDALVAEVAVAVVPEPVPVVVEAILGELASSARAEPQIVVDAGGHGRDRACGRWCRAT